MFSDVPIYYKWFTNRFIWPIDGILKATTALSQSGPGWNGNEEVLYTLELQGWNLCTRRYLVPYLEPNFG